MENEPSIISPLSTKATKEEQAEAQLKAAARMFVQTNSANLTDA